MSMKISGSPGNKLLYAGFNQDYGCFACGMKDGFRIYNSDPLKEKDKREMGGSGMGVVEMLFRCNYIAFVGDGSNPLYSANKVIIWDDLKNKSVVELEFSSVVRAVRLRRDRIVAVMEGLIKVYTFTQTPQQVNAFETCSNLAGLCVLCPNSDNSLLAFPARKLGHVELVDLAEADKSPILISAHETNIACMSLNSTGCLLATASAKGTLIRIFDTKSGSKVQELRRGSNHAVIYSINFNTDSSMLCVSSNHHTIHIFNLKNNPSHTSLNSSHTLLNPTNQYAAPPQLSFNSAPNPTSISYPPSHTSTTTTNNASNSTKSHFSSFLPDYFSSTWSFAKFHIQTSSKIICCFSPQVTNTSCNYVIVLSGEGSYYKYKVSEKGECYREVYLQYIDKEEDRGV